MPWCICGIIPDWKGNGYDAYGRFGGETAMWESVRKGEFGKGRFAPYSRDHEAYGDLRVQVAFEALLKALP